MIDHLGLNWGESIELKLREVKNPPMMGAETTVGIVVISGVFLRGEFGGDFHLNTETDWVTAKFWLYKDLRFSGTGTITFVFILSFLSKYYWYFSSTVS